MTSALTTSSPLLSLLLAFILLKEKITWKQILGTILIVMGVLIISMGTLA
ncbi:MAG: EamA family transporter [Candidatus Korarchaeota archaeon]|nr:EamA family transporter [Candidatus Korarchaeota archaeon]